VDDGLLSFSVNDIVSLECDQYGIICSVDNAGMKHSLHRYMCIKQTLVLGFLGESKGINLPSYSPNKISLTAQDIEDVKFGMDQNVDFITLSCIRTETEIMEVRKILGNTKIKILSKIENREGLERFEAILKISDGIIIDRGYLGVEIDITKIAIVQKNIIHRCQIAGKPVLLSNQILESMKELPRPSRSEASDITSAVVDGTDCIILSGETAIGQYPTESVFWLRKICSEAEHHIDYMEKQISIMKNVPKPIAISESIACSAGKNAEDPLDFQLLWCILVKCAREVNAACIIVYTEAGGTARLVAKYRPSIPVVVTTNCQRTARQLSVSFGLTSHFTEECGSLDNKEKSLQNAISFILESKLAKQGDSVIITCGQVVGFAEGTTTTMRVLTL
jgi:pyruvate kinase